MFQQVPYCLVEPNVESCILVALLGCGFFFCAPGQMNLLLFLSTIPPTTIYSVGTGDSLPYRVSVSLAYVAFLSMWSLYLYCAETVQSPFGSSSGGIAI